jgi:hypothetical protein
MPQLFEGEASEEVRTNLTLILGLRNVLTVGYYRRIS